MSISENSRFIALSPENGSQFTEGQKVIFEVKPSISFLKGKDCYISLDLERDSDNASMAHPVQLAGASGCIERMDIFSLESGQLLESLNNYNLWTAIENQYTTDNTDNLVYKEGCVEPVRSHIIGCNAETKAITTTAETIVVGSSGATRLSTISSDGFDKGFVHKFVIPIKSGVFNHYSDDEKLTPNLLFGGMRIEITLAKNEHVLSRVHSQDATGVAHLCTTRANGIPCDASVNTEIVTTANFSHTQNGGFCVGRQVTLVGDTSAAGGGETKTITAVAIVANKLKITCADGSGNFTSGGNAKIHHPTGNKLKYIVKNMELKVLEVIPPLPMMKQAIKESQYDFISYEVFTDNLPTTSLRHQIEFPSVSTKGKAIFTHYINDQFSDDDSAPNYYQGSSPTATNLNSVQYFINNRNYPLKAYNPNCFSDRIVAYNEIVKAMKAVGLNVKKLGDSRNMNDYSFTYLTARELARGKDFVYPLKDTEPQLRTEYSAVRAQNHRLLSFVFSVRSIMVGNNSLSVVY